MKIRPAALIVATCFAAVSLFSAVPAAAPVAPVRALLITGGCCHDYKLQANALIEGMKKFGDVTWTVINEGGTTTRGQIKLYDDPDWAKPYDVIVHNECFADTDDPAYIRKITAGHRAGKPAVVIHCAMHSYRAATIDDWREFLGVTSRRHDSASRVLVKPVMSSHAALREFPTEWLTPVDELYVIEKAWPTTKALATSVSPQDGKEYPVIWTSDYHGARVFGTTVGHSSATWADPVFIGLVSRGVLWAAGREK
ncbi:MAG: ThuA domain-containing protein [Opitutaceae bacterium]